MNAILPYVYWILRLGFGTVITGAGLGKLLDLPGFVKVFETYQLKLPSALNWTLATTLMFFELGLGLWILSGWRLPLAMIFSMLMHAGYFILLSTTIIRGIDLQNCGCFGVFLARPLTWRGPASDLLFVVLSYALRVITLRLGW